MKEEDNKIIINDKEYEIIAYIQIESGNFIVYTDNKQLENNKVALYINRVSKENEEIVLDEVDNEEVTQVIEKLKERLMDKDGK